MSVELGPFEPGPQSLVLRLKFFLPPLCRSRNLVQPLVLSAEIVTLVANSDGGFFPRLSVAVHVE